MCQIHSEKLTKKLKDRCKGKRSVTFYKIFYISSEGVLQSPYKYYDYPKQKEPYTTSTKKGFIFESDIVKEGFHCIDSEESKERYKSIIDFPYNIILEIKVKPKDIVSKGPLFNFSGNSDWDNINHSVVVSSFSIPEKEWKKVKEMKENPSSN